MHNTLEKSYLLPPPWLLKRLPDLVRDLPIIFAASMPAFIIGRLLFSSFQLGAEEAAEDDA